MDDAEGNHVEPAITLLALNDDDDDDIDDDDNDDDDDDDDDNDDENDENDEDEDDDSLICPMVLNNKCFGLFLLSDL